MCPNSRMEESTSELRDERVNILIQVASSLACLITTHFLFLSLYKPKRGKTYLSNCEDSSQLAHLPRRVTNFASLAT